MEENGNIAEEWYHGGGGEKHGPFSREKLCARLSELKGGDTWVIGPGISAWTRARDVSGLIRTTDEEEEAPHISLWLLYLFIKPKTFFRHFVITSTPALTVLCALTYGMAGAIDRLETHFLQGESSLFAGSWGTYWIYVVFTGLIGAAFFTFIGGWWYRLRLKWSGAVKPNANLALRVYLFASQVYAIPTLIQTATETAQYPTPGAASASEGSLWYLLLMIFPFWSVWNSYVGVRTAFVVRRVPAMVWFLILPGIVYALFVGGIIIALLSGALGAPADAAHPNSYHTDVLSFSYPGNWVMDESNENFDPDTSVFVEPVMQDAMIHIMLYESTESFEQELESTLEKFTEVLEELEPIQDYESLGKFKGVGRKWIGQIQGRDYYLRIFLSEVDENLYLETNEIWQKNGEEKIVPGFQQVLSTLNIQVDALKEK